MVVTERFQKSFTFNWGVSTIEFGSGKSGKLAEIIEGMNAKKILIVTDKGVIQAGILTKIEEPLKAAKLNYTVFDEVEPNPLDKTVEKGLELVPKNIKKFMHDTFISPAPDEARQILRQAEVYKAQGRELARGIVDDF